MSAIKTPMLSVLIGEGGSGGALALAVADEVWMLENAVYSVISPEGCASILWKDSSKVKQASENLKLTADDLKSLGVVERIIKEDETIFKNLHDDMYELIRKNLKLDKDELVLKRYTRYRRMGNLND
jgi:acetyl-CoA carboxylase carboxyl transferase subunit alpha